MTLSLPLPPCPPAPQTEKVWDPHKVTPSGVKLPVASDKERPQYFYNDR